ncbi:MAG TPA: VWA domain-containing protein [Pyrinomonadaceae bacterium]|nr:VWA domain-containing protein [Pyrinomonadaceae bacterium]
MRGTEPRRVGLGVFTAFWFIVLAGPVHIALAQSPSVASSETGVSARPVTIPITIRVKGTPDELELKSVDLAVMEDGDPQTLISIRAMGSNSPLNLIVLIQDDVVSSIALEMKSLAGFIRGLPRGSRVAVGYIRTGTLQLRQKFTQDLERAAKSLRSPVGLASAAPYNPYVEVIEGLKKFDSQPTGRRAVLLVSDGLDISRGTSAASAGQSIDLQRAINEAQRRSVAIYSFFAPTTTSSRNGSFSSDGQSSLQRLSDETGGHAFFQGLGAPTSFDPFLKELSSALDRQIALTYLSTHPSKGFHKIKINSSRPDVDIDYPSGYTRK